MTATPFDVSIRCRSSRLPHRRPAQRRNLRLALVLLLALPVPGLAQLSERFGPYELHYSVVNSSFVEPAVAAQYGLTRGRRRALLNLFLREHLENGTTVARRMDLKGSSRDLTARRIGFDFIEVREGPAIYYIGEFKFINREYRFFDVSFTAEGDAQRHEFSFKKQMWIND